MKLVLDKDSAKKLGLKEGQVIKVQESMESISRGSIVDQYLYITNKNNPFTFDLVTKYPGGSFELSYRGTTFYYKSNKFFDRTDNYKELKEFILNNNPKNINGNYILQADSPTSLGGIIKLWLVNMIDEESIHVFFSRNEAVYWAKGAK